MMSILRRLLASFTFVSLIAPALAAGAEAPAEPALYSRQDSFARTMVASRRSYAAWKDQAHEKAPVTLGPWYVTKPVAGKFAAAGFPEKGIDLTAKAKDGKALWSKADLPDEQVNNLSGRDEAATYLYRVIKAERAITLTAGFGSDDGLAVWLNGKPVLAKDVPRGPEVDQDTAALPLTVGDNALLLKVYNRTGGHGFAFSLLRDPARAIWKQVERDFPTEASALRTDLPNNAHLQYFTAAGKNADVETRLINKTIEGLGPLAAGVRQEVDALRQAKTSPEDPRWLDLYVRSAATRKMLTAAGGINLAALRLAIEDLSATYPGKYTRGPELLKRLDAVQARLLDLKGKPAADAAKATADIGRDVLALQQEALLANPLLDFDKLLLVKRGAKQLGLPQNWQGNCALPTNGYENEIAVMSPVRPGGSVSTFYKPEAGRFVGDVDLHWDADRMLFSMPGGQHQRWQVWELKADGTGLRQVTAGVEPDVDNYDACYRPDGKVIYASTLCFQGVPCVGGGNTVANMAVCDADGKNIRQLTFDQDHNWSPTMLNDGRVMYTRWEYSDTAHYFTRILFRMNPDGTGQGEHYGSNSYWPNSLFYARPIPGHPTKVAAIVSGHHGVPRMGELVILDPAAGQREADGVVQRIPGYGKTVVPVIKDTLVDSSWPRFLHPYPLSEKYFLVSCQPDRSSPWGIYLVDTFDNMVLLAEQPGYALFEPVPFRKSDKPPVVPDRVKPDQRDATFYVADVYAGQGLKGVPRGTVKSMRVSELHYAYPRMGGHKDVGVEGPWDVRRIVGTVPVAEDGSTYFKAPANTPLVLHPLDGEGKALQIMRSWVTGMPGEAVSCVGCHERQNEAAPTRAGKALAYAPADVKPWYGPTRGFSFKREVQPVLDRYCVGCHDGSASAGPNGIAKAAPDLSYTGKNGKSGFAPSYLALHPFVRRPGPESDDHLQVPLEFHADTSELVQMLRKGHYNVKLDAEAWDRLVTWIDLNVPHHGTWGEQRGVPNRFKERRLEMRTKYANRPEDPEAIPAMPAGPPVTFIVPEPVKSEPVAKVDCPNWPFDAAAAKKLQAAAGPTTRKVLDLGEGVSIEMVLIPAGEFVMGSADGAADERPLAKVRIARPFWMSATEVSNRQYARFNARHDSGFVDQHHKDHTLPGYPANLPDQPVCRVSWNDAREFAAWVSKETKVKADLPTEAQWEWACRAGADRPFSYGGLDDDFSPFANLADLSLRLMAVNGVNPQPIANPSAFEDFLPKDTRFNDGSMVTSAAGKYRPNAWGLFDLHGNVAEWTRSAYQPYPYRDEDGRNDLAPTGEKAVRGGSFFDRPKRATSSFRLGYRPYHAVHNVGFRIVCDANP